MKSSEFDEYGSRDRIVFLGNKYLEIYSMSFKGGGIDILMKLLYARHAFEITSGKSVSIIRIIVLICNINVLNNHDLLFTIILFNILYKKILVSKKVFTIVNHFHFFRSKTL